MAEKTKMEILQDYARRFTRLKKSTSVEVQVFQKMAARHVFLGEKREKRLWKKLVEELDLDPGLNWTLDLTRFEQTGEVELEITPELPVKLDHMDDPGCRCALCQVTKALGLGDGQIQSVGVYQMGENGTLEEVQSKTFSNEEEEETPPPKLH